MRALLCFALFFFFNDTATTEIYTLSLHDALPISLAACNALEMPKSVSITRPSWSNMMLTDFGIDRKSTRLNSSHVRISYAVFCLKKKTDPSRQDTRGQAAGRRSGASTQLARQAGR